MFTYVKTIFHADGINDSDYYKENSGKTDNLSSPLDTISKVKRMDEFVYAAKIKESINFVHSSKTKANIVY